MMSKGAETRRRIIEEAARLFNRRGYSGSSLQDVMEATGLEKGGIYRHFSNKEELAAEAFDHAWNAAFELRMHDLDDLSDSIGKLKKLVGNFVERRPSVPGGCPLLNTAIDADDGNTLLRERARKALKSFQAKIEGLVESGVERREIRHGVNAREVANTVIGALEGALMIARLERNDDPLRHAKAHLESFLDSLLRQPNHGKA